MPVTRRMRSAASKRAKDAEESVSTKRLSTERKKKQPKKTPEKVIDGKEKIDVIDSSKKFKSLADVIQGSYPRCTTDGIGARGKRQSFEINIQVNDNVEPVNIWSGLKLGPPRKLKFPEADIIIESIKKMLSK